MKERIVFYCSNCGKQTTTTNKRIAKYGECAKCRVKKLVKV